MRRAAWGSATADGEVEGEGEVGPRGREDCRTAACPRTTRDCGEPVLVPAAPAAPAALPRRVAACVVCARRGSEGGVRGSGEGEGRWTSSPASDGVR